VQPAAKAFLKLYYAHNAKNHEICCHMQATVYKSTGSWYIVKDATGRLWNARTKGVLKIDHDITSSNPIAVGDMVTMDVENEETASGMITAIADRRNYINRQSPANKHQHHIVAANIDQSLLVATLKEPRTSGGFMDRFLITCTAYQVPATIIFNKADLYGKKEMDQFERYKDIYTAAGYRVELLSLQQQTNTEILKELLKDKISLLSGHSGVGKSTFINLLFPQLALRTQEVSGWSGKGLHTTTFAEMFDLPFGGHIIDTPGVREFGLVNISKQELSHYFPEMQILIQNCQFNNCLHMNEPGCAIKAAVNENVISEERYISYCTLLDGIVERKY
jgi:ribosome biogenesis GTPase / thiamine phosphate phosphatase